MPGNETLVAPPVDKQHQGAVANQCRAHSLLALFTAMAQTEFQLGFLRFVVVLKWPGKVDVSADVTGAVHQKRRAGTVGGAAMISPRLGMAKFTVFEPHSQRRVGNAFMLSSIRDGTRSHRKENYGRGACAPLAASIVYSSAFSFAAVTATYTPGAKNSNKAVETRRMAH